MDYRRHGRDWLQFVRTDGSEAMVVLNSGCGCMSWIARPHQAERIGVWHPARPSRGLCSGVHHLKEQAARCCGFSPGPKRPATRTLSLTQGHGRSSPGS